MLATVADVLKVDVWLLTAAERKSRRTVSASALVAKPGQSMRLVPLGAGDGRRWPGAKDVVLWHSGSGHFGALPSLGQVWMPTSYCFLLQGKQERSVKRGTVSSE
jgi:hypothetical protein